jgi:hypothetical protein
LLAFFSFSLAFALSLSNCCFASLTPLLIALKSNALAISLPISPNICSESPPIVPRLCFRLDLNSFIFFNVSSNCLVSIISTSIIKGLLISNGFFNLSTTSSMPNTVTFSTGSNFICLGLTLTSLTSALVETKSATLISPFFNLDKVKS